MIVIDISGYKKIEALHLVLDYNGTLAVDGQLIKGVKNRLELLSSKLTIHIVTADTFNTSKKELGGLHCCHEILSPSRQDIQKELYITKLGKEHVIAIGNGRNDMLMIQQAALGIMVIQKEGGYAPLFQIADIVCFSIIDALELLLNPLRMTATLRN